MVIKNTKKMKLLSISYNQAMCKPCLEKSSKDSNKVYQLFARIAQNMISVIPRKTLIAGFHFSKFGCCKPMTFPKELHHGCLANFFRIQFSLQLADTVGADICPLIRGVRFLESLTILVLFSIFFSLLYLYLE